MLITLHLYLHPQLFFQNSHMNSQLFSRYLERNPSKLFYAFFHLSSFSSSCFLLQRKVWPSTHFPELHNWHHPQILPFYFQPVDVFYWLTLNIFCLHYFFSIHTIMDQIRPSAAAAAAAAKSLQSCPTLYDQVDGSPPGSPIPGILQARTLEWVTISFSNAWKWKVKVKSLSCVQLLATPWTAAYQAPPSWDFPGKSTGVGCHYLLQLGHHHLPNVHLQLYILPSPQVKAWRLSISHRTQSGGENWWRDLGFYLQSHLHRKALNPRLWRCC